MSHIQGSPGIRHASPVRRMSPHQGQVYYQPSPGYAPAPAYGSPVAVAPVAQARSPQPQTIPVQTSGVAVVGGAGDETLSPPKTNGSTAAGNGGASAVPSQARATTPPSSRGRRTQVLKDHYDGANDGAAANGGDDSHARPRNNRAPSPGPSYARATSSSSARDVDGKRTARSGAQRTPKRAPSPGGRRIRDRSPKPSGSANKPRWGQRNPSPMRRASPNRRSPSPGRGRLRPEGGRSMEDVSVVLGLGTLSLPFHQLTSLRGLGTRTDLCELYLQGNFLNSFQGLDYQPHLKELHVENNNISSFNGSVTQPKLATVWLTGNPITTNPNYRLMTMMAFGNSVRKIDGEPVTSFEREQAKKFGPKAATAVRAGWLLDNKHRSAEEYDALISEYTRAAQTLDAPALPSNASVTSTSTPRKWEKRSPSPAHRQHSAGSHAGSLVSVSRQGSASDNPVAKIVELNNRVAELETLLSSERSRAEMLETRLEQRDAEMAKFKMDQLEWIQASNSGLKAEKDARQRSDEQVEQLQSQVADLTATIEEQKRWESELTNAKKTNEHNQRHLSSAQEQNEALRKGKQALEGNVTLLQDRLATLEKENADLTANLESRENEVQDARREQDRLSKLADGHERSYLDAIAQADVYKKQIPPAEDETDPTKFRFTPDEIARFDSILFSDVALDNSNSSIESPVRLSINDSGVGVLGPDYNAAFTIPFDENTKIIIAVDNTECSEVSIVNGDDKSVVISDPRAKLIAKTVEALLNGTSDN